MGVLAPCIVYVPVGVWYPRREEAIWFPETRVRDSCELLCEY